MQEHPESSNFHPGAYVMSPGQVDMHMFP